MSGLRLLFPMVLLVAACARSENASSLGADLVGRVSYYGFEVQRITGILEQEIEEYGCDFEISREAFDRAVLHQIQIGTNQVYNPSDVRAKVVFGTEIIYIDSSGVGRLIGGNDFLVDKEVFVSNLVAVGSCD